MNYGPDGPNLNKAKILSKNPISFLMNGKTRPGGRANGLGAA